MNQVASVKCLGVLAQVTMGYYDEDGNLVHEELFPQVEGNVLTAKLFHPHVEQLAKLLETCVEQAWNKLNAQRQANPPALAADGAARNGEMADRPAEQMLPPR